MRFIVMVPANKEYEAGAMPEEKDLKEMGKFNEEMVKAGITILAADGLKPSSKGVRIKYENGRATVKDGPFTESKELVAGFWLLEARSTDEIVAWMKRAPFGGGVEIEIRPVFELEDFGKALTPEIREREERLRRQAAEQRG